MKCTMVGWNWFIHIQTGTECEMQSDPLQLCDGRQLKIAEYALEK